MLYDQSQLLQVYIDAYLSTGDALFKTTAHDIAAYIVTDALAHPEGGFYSSEDADSLPTFDSEEKKG